MSGLAGNAEPNRDFRRLSNEPCSKCCVLIKQMVRKGVAAASKRHLTGIFDRSTVAQHIHLLCVRRRSVSALKKRTLICAGLSLSSVLVAAPAQAQNVSFIARQDFDPNTTLPSVAVGDFNGDGVQDLAVATGPIGLPTQEISVLLGNGD